MKKTLNIAHRGFSSQYPENTMIAFEKAIEAGADGLEIDVHMTRDGHLVIIHDEYLDRTTTGTGLVYNYTLRELKNFDAGIRFNKHFKGQTIPTLREFLTFCSGKGIFIELELKNSIIKYAGIETEVYKMIHEFNMQNNVIVSSFNHASIKYCKTLDENIKTGVLYSHYIFEPYKYAKLLYADAIHPEYHSLNKKTVTNAHRNNIIINCYTVNSKKDMKKMIDLGIDGIITNYPDILKTLL